MPYRRLGERWPRLGGGIGAPGGGGGGIVNLLSNGDFELPGIPAAPTDWAVFNGALLTTVADPRTGSAGVASLNIENGIAAAGYCQQDLITFGKTINNGQEVTAQVWCKRVNTNPLIRIVDNSGVLAAGTTANVDWTLVTVTATIIDNISVVLRLQNVNSTLGLSSRFDDAIFYISG